MASSLVRNIIAIQPHDDAKEMGDFLQIGAFPKVPEMRRLAR